MSRRLYSKRYRPLHLAVMLALPLLSSIYTINSYSRVYYVQVCAMRYMLIFTVVIQACVVPFIFSLAYLVYIVVLCIGFNAHVMAMHTERRLEVLSFILLVVLYCGYVAVNNYIFVSANIASFNNNNLGTKNAKKIEEFVDRLLPKHVRESVGSQESIGETANDVTLLFADIVGFTQYSSGKTPADVVDLLSRLFTSFDKECNKLNLYKVYTIGDCYVVMSFLDKHNRLSPEKECVDVVELGFKMIDIIGRVRKEVNFDGLHMRIGIHTGRIIGGVIGTGIIRYDLYGHDVLIANKMESSGKEDAVHISEATKLMIESSGSKQYRYTEDELVYITALQTSIKTYFIDKLGLDRKSNLN